MELKIHAPDGLHGWGIEYQGEHPEEFVSTCSRIFKNKTIFPGIWFHQADTGQYQFFEYWGPAEEEACKRAMLFLMEELTGNREPKKLYPHVIES